MNDLFNNILTSSSGSITLQSTFIAMLASLLLGIIIAITYFLTQEEETYQRSFSIALLMLPVVLCVIIIFVESNMARAFSLGGTLSIIRFRSTAGDSKDIAFIFFDIAAGLACGVGFYGYGAAFVIFLCTTVFIAQKVQLFSRKRTPMLLKITVPENLNYQSVFDDIIDEYTTVCHRIKVKTVDLGALFEVQYSLKLKDCSKEREFINALRCRNGNLTVILTEIS